MVGFRGEGLPEYIFSDPGVDKGAPEPATTEVVGFPGEGTPKKTFSHRISSRLPSGSGRLAAAAATGAPGAGWLAATVAQGRGTRSNPAADSETKSADRGSRIPPSRYLGDPRPRWKPSSIP